MRGRLHSGHAPPGGRRSSCVSLDGRGRIQTMMAAVFEVIGYIIGEMLVYVFARLLLSIVLTVCAVILIRWLIPDQTVSSVLSVIVALFGLVGGIAWEIRAAD